MNKQHPNLSPLLTAKEAATRLKVSDSWMAKACMRGDGPPYIRIGRSIRYAEAALILLYSQNDLYCLHNGLNRDSWPIIGAIFLARGVIRLRHAI